MANAEHFSNVNIEWFVDFFETIHIFYDLLDQ